MNRLRSLSRLDWVSAGIVIAAIALVVLPPPKLNIPSITGDLLAAEQIDLSQSAMVEYAEQFDITKLPVPIIKAPVTPPPDPLSAIRRFSLVGVTMTEEISIALVSVGGDIQTVKLGETLAGFEVTAITAQQINLRKGDLDTHLSLRN